VLNLKTRTIRLEWTIPAEAEEVYDAFMDPAKHAEFTGDKASGSSVVGKEFHAYSGYILAKNLELEPGRKIVQEWTTSEWPEGASPSILTITFKKSKGGTKLTMVHSLVPEEQSDDYEAGWKEHYWSKLESYFEARKRSNSKRV
jgi:activator of HSP90 ATPase